MKGTYRFSDGCKVRATELMEKGITIPDPGLLERILRRERFVVIEQSDKWVCSVRLEGGEEVQMTTDFIEATAEKVEDNP